MLDSGDANAKDGVRPALVIVEQALRSNAGHERRNAEAMVVLARREGRRAVVLASEQLPETIADELRAEGAEIRHVGHARGAPPRSWGPFPRRAAEPHRRALAAVAAEVPAASVLICSATPQMLHAAADVAWGPAHHLMLQFLTPGRWKRHAPGPAENGATPVPAAYRRAAATLASRGAVFAAQSARAADWLSGEFGAPVRVLPLPYLPSDWREAPPLDPALAHKPRIGIQNFSRGDKLHPAAIETVRQTADRVDWIVHMGRDNRMAERLRPELSGAGVAELIDDVLPPDPYNDMIAGLDAVLLPYDATLYRLQMSGIIVHAMGQGVVPIAPEGSAPASVMEAEGLGLTFAPGTGAGMVAAVERFLAERAALSKAARARMAAVRARNAPEVFLADCEATA